MHLYSDDASKTNYLMGTHEMHLMVNVSFVEWIHEVTMGYKSLIAATTRRVGSSSIY